MPTNEQMQKMVSFSAEGIIWMAILANIQLGLRHPQNNGPSARVAHDACMQILEKLKTEGILTADEAAQIYRDEMICTARGWDKTT
jgi:hypothetical protein